MDNSLEQIKNIVLQHLEPYQIRVYLYGSRAKNLHRAHSDVDIAYLAKDPLPPGVFGELREKIEQSNVVLTVDFVDLAASDLEFREKVIQEGILWKD